MKNFVWKYIETVAVEEGQSKGKTKTAEGKISTMQKNAAGEQTLDQLIRKWANIRNLLIKLT